MECSGESNSGADEPPQSADRYSGTSASLSPPDVDSQRDSKSASSLTPNQGRDELRPPSSDDLSCFPYGFDSYDSCTGSTGLHGQDYHGTMGNLEGQSELKSLPMLPPLGLEEDLCPVCNDKVSGYHYGLQTCESCKGFFKRSVQNQKRYACVENQSCVIDKAQRKRCPYCRFQKCLSVGMKLEAVRPDRMRGGRNKFGPIYRRDRALRRQMRSQFHTDADLEAIAKAAASATLSQAPSDMHIFDYPTTNTEEIDIKPTIAELGRFSALSGFGSGMPSSGNYPSMQGASSDSRMSSSFTRMQQRHQQRGGFSRPTEMQFNYPVDPLSGLSGMAASIGGNPYMHDRDYMLTMPNMHHQQQQQHLIRVSSMSTQSGRGLPTSQYPSNQPQQPYLQQQQNPPHLGQSPAPPSSPYTGQQQSTMMPGPLYSAHTGRPSAETMPRYSDARHGYISVPTSTVPGIHISPSPRDTVQSTTSDLLESSTTDTDFTAEAELQASRVPVTLQLIVDLKRPMASRSGERANEALRCLVDELLRQPVSSCADGSDVVQRAVALACRVCDQQLFQLVEWARQAHFFRQLSVEDQMRLLENCWSELLLLEILYKQLEHTDTHRLLMVTGHFVSVNILERIGLSGFCDQLLDLVRRIRCLKLDINEYTCLKFIILLNSDVPGLCDVAHVEQSRAEVSAALLDYCSLLNMTVGDDEQMTDKFGQMLLELSEIKLASLQVEDFLYQHHVTGTITDSHLLVEMLLSSRQ